MDYKSASIDSRTAFRGIGRCPFGRDASAKTLVTFLRVWCGIAIAGVLATAQSTSNLQRENGRWLYTESGAVALGHADTVRIEVSGRLELVQAAAGERMLRFKLRAESSAASREDAVRQLSGIRFVAEPSASILSAGLIAAPRQRSAITLRIEIPERVKVFKVRQLGGDVEANALQAKLYAQIYAGEGRFERLQSGLVVFSGGGNLTVRAVRGNVEISSGGGSVSIQDVRGEVRCELGGGDIEIRDVSGPLEASTGGGNVVIDRAQDSVFANTQGGLLEVRNAQGPVVARNREGILRVFSSRDVKAYAPTGPIQLLDVDGSIALSTATGNVYAELGPKGIASASRITSEVGDITIVVPQRLKLTVEAESRCTCGVPVVSDYPETKHPAWTGGADATVSRVALNGGGPSLRLVSNGGRIIVKKARAE